MTYKPLIEDFPEQFRNKKNISAVLNAFDRQFRELMDVFLSMQGEKNKLALQNAAGSQLDRIGDIVGLTRQQAGNLLGSRDATLDDDNYRNLIGYKISKNNCDSSYYDIITMVNMFRNWSSLRYSEDGAHPATIVLDLDADEQIDENSFDIPFAKAAGVGLCWRANAKDSSTIYMGTALQEMVTQRHESDVPNI